MDFLGKDKLARLDDERQQRRKARANEAVKRLDEVGKKTQQTVTAHIQNGGETNAKPGGLSRVLFEHAAGIDQQHDGRRANRRSKRQDHAGIQAEGHRALGAIDHAMSSIQGALVDATGAGLKNGLEGAARSVSDAVQRVSTLANGAEGQHAASNNPLAELMAEEAAEQQQDQKADQETNGKPAHELGHVVNDAVGGPQGAHNLVAGTADANGQVASLEHRVQGLGHEVSQAVQHGGNATRDALNVPRQLGQSLVAHDPNGSPDAAPKDAASNVTANILNAPRDLAHNVLGAPREALERAADGPRQIAEGLRDAPAHAIENVTQIAGHVARNHGEGLGALGNLVDATRDPASALTTAGNAIRDTAQSVPRTVAQNVVQGVDQARENLDPTRVASQAASAFSPRNIVEAAANLGGVRDPATNIDPRAVAERTTAAVDPRNLLRGSVDPSRVLESKTPTAPPATGTPNAAGPNAAGPNAAGPNAARPKAGPNTAGPNAAGPNAARPNAAGPNAAGPNAAATTATTNTATPTTHAPAAAGAAGVHAANAQHANQPQAAPAHAIAGGHSGAIAAPPPAHSSAVVPARGNPSGAAPAPAPPAPSPTTPAHSSLPASERATPAAHVQPSRDRASSTVAAGGQTTITPQPVVDVAPPTLDRKQSPIQQPGFTIEMRGESGALPALPPAPAPPQVNQPPVSTPAPPAVTNTPTTATRTVPPLAPAPPTASTAANPAIAAGRTAIAAVTVPQGTITPLPPSNTSVAPAAAPTPAGPAHPGPGAVKTSAQATVTPPTPPVPTPAIAATPASPKTPTPSPPAPVVPQVRQPGGDNVPDPASIVQANVSLTPDRTATAQAISAEAQSQSSVSPETQAQRASLIGPLGSQMQTTGHSADAPMTNAASSSQQQGQAAAAAARAREAQEAATGRQQIASQLQGAQAERAQFAAMPPPSILQQTSSAAMQPVVGSAQAAVQSTATAVGASPVQLDPAVVARSAAAGAVQSTLPPFDAARFDHIDQHAPAPSVHTTAVDAAQETAAQNYQVANQQIQTLQNIPPPIVNVPASPNLGKLTSGGQPTREAAIARIEQEVAQQANAQAPGQMRAAAAPVQAQLTTHVTTSESTARSQATSQVNAAQAQAQEITTKPPPITGAQAAAQAQPEYLQHQTAAATAHEQMRTQIAGAHGAAEASAQAARGVRDQQLQTAQGTYQSEVQGQVMPQYAAQQQAANTQFHAQNETAQQAMATEQTQAQVTAQTEADQAKAKADADIASHQAQLDQQRAAAVTSHQQQAQHATQQHEASMQQQQAQMDAQVQQHQSEMHSQVAAAQAQGQQEVNQHLTDGESGYRTQIQQGEQQANAEKQKAEREAAAKQAQADEEKKKHSGGVFGGIIGWVKDRVNDLMNAVKSVLSAARDMVVSLMEKARQAAMAVLEKARQAAIAAMQKAKSAIQGVISACASAIRSVITAVANQIKSLIQSLANVLKGLVAALTQMLSALVAAYQAAMNAVMNGLIAAVSFVNKDLGDKLRTSTQKYRDSFNNAMNGLKSGIDAAGTALQAGIQRSADNAMAVVDSAETTLNDSVTRAEQTMNAAVESAYQTGVTAINTAFDAAEFVVNKAFDVAEAAVKAYFDLQIGAISVVQKGIDAVADFAIEVADQVMTAIDKIAQAVVSLIPDSWKKMFVDFWNGPWRSVIIIGLATIAAVAITAATLGTGAPVAAVLLAAVIGGSIAGTAYFGGEMVARESDIALSTQGKGMYVTGFGDVQIGKDGKPIPPPNLSGDKLQEFEKQTELSMSNFNLQRDQNGQVTGYDRKSGSEITNYAAEEGMKGFAEGAISSGLAVAGGSLGGAAVKGLGLAAESTMGSVVSTGVSAVITGPVQSTLTASFDAGFEALKKGGNPIEAFKAGLAAGGKAIKDPGTWAAALLSIGVAPIKLKFLTKPLEGALESSGSKIENKVAQTVIKKGADVITDSMTQTLGSAGGGYISAYAEAKAKGLSDAQAREAGMHAADAAFKPEAIAMTLALNTAGTIAAPPHGPAAHEGPEGAHPATHETTEGVTPHANDDVHATPASTATTPPPTETAVHPKDSPPSTTRTSSDAHTPISEPNPATTHTSNAPTPTQTQPVQHSTTEPRPIEHPNEMPTSTPRTTGEHPTGEAPVTATPAAPTTADRVAPSEHPQENKPKAELVATHELPPSKPISEQEPRLDAIALNADGSPAEAVAAVREARSEIAKLKAQREKVDGATGKWQQATPEERAAQVKLIDDQIKQTAQDAVDKYDRLALSAKDDATALKQIENRTPQEIEARKQEIADARAASAKRDVDLQAAVVSKTQKIGNESHVAEVFDHVTMGAGFAGVANETSRPKTGGANDIMIGGANPWDGAKQQLGQKSGASNVPGAATGHSMNETVSDPNARFMLASEHADNVALAKNDAELRTFNGQSGALEPGPQDNWPQFAKDSGARVRMEVTGPDGTKRWFYAKSVDGAVGPGPARMLKPEQLDADTLARMKKAGAFALGDQGFDPSKLHGGQAGEVGVFGPSAAGAWGVEASAAQTDANGKKNNVEWMGRSVTPDGKWPPETRAKYDRIQAELGAAHDSKDPARIQAAEKANTDFLFEEAPGNGNLPRNQLEGGAFDEKMAVDNGGNVSRRIGDIQKVTFEVDPSTGTERVKMVLTNKGPNGEPVVIWKDSLVLAIGQNASGDGGPAKLLANYKGQLEPIYGQTKDGFTPVVGLQSPDGAVRLLGAAATPRDVSELLDQKKLSTDDHQANLRQQAAGLGEDSKGVIPGFELAEQTIRAANAPQSKDQLVAVLGETADQQRQQNGAPAPDATGAPVQRKAIAGARAARDPASIAARGVSGAGAPLPHLDAIQRSFGRHDISSVTAHSNTDAHASSDAIGAEAYTHGSAVAFKGQPDLHTAAHEAAHVIQQRSGRVPAGLDGGSGDPLEQHADQVADRVVAGESAEALLDPMSGGGSEPAAVQRRPARSQQGATAHGAGAKAHRPTAEQVMNDELVVDGAAIDAASAKYDVPSTEIRAIITQESRGNADANAGAEQKDKGKHAASGLMQVTEASWKQAQREHAELAQYDFATYRYDRRVNILVGTAVLAGKRSSLVKMGMDAKGPNMAALTAMAYNAGQGLVEKAYKNAVAGGSKHPDADCLKPEYLKPAIKASPEVYAYYLTGAGKSRNPQLTVEAAVELKYKEISDYPSQISSIIAKDTHDHAAHPAHGDTPKKPPIA